MLISHDVFRLSMKLESDNIHILNDHGDCWVMNWDYRMMVYIHWFDPDYDDEFIATKVDLKTVKKLMNFFAMKGGSFLFEIDNNDISISTTGVDEENNIQIKSDNDDLRAIRIIYNTKQTEYNNPSDGNVTVPFDDLFDALKFVTCYVSSGKLDIQLVNISVSNENNPLVIRFFVKDYRDVIYDVDMLIAPFFAPP